MARDNDPLSLVFSISLFGGWVVLEAIDVVEEFLARNPKDIDEALGIVEKLNFKILNWTRLEGDTYMIFVLSKTGTLYTIYVNIPVESEFDIIINIM
jgi:hypothetical protein